MERILAFYTVGDGTFEQFEMYRIDFDEAQARFPERWSLEAPSGATVVDKRPTGPDMNPQAIMDQIKAEAAKQPQQVPIVPMTDAQVKDRVRGASRR